MKNFNLSAPAIAESEHAPRIWIKIELQLYDGGQPVAAFAQASASAGQIGGASSLQGQTWGRGYQSEMKAGRCNFNADASHKEGGWNLLTKTQHFMQT